MIWSRSSWLVGVGAASAIFLQNVAAQQKGLPNTEQADRLKLVQIIVRHGARTPLTDSYWEGATWDKGTDCGEAYKALQLSIRSLDGGPQPPASHDAKQARSVLPGGCTKGELTVPGQLQSRELGQYLRQRYIQNLQFLSPQYQDTEVEARSTNYRRTIATLQGLLTGLWPDASSAVPMRVAQDVDEVMFGRADSCERLKDLMKQQAKALKESAKTDSKIQDLEKRAKEAMHLPEDHRIRFTDLHDALTSMRFHGKQTPKGVSEELLMDINREATRRMTALVAPQTSEGVSEELLTDINREATRRMTALVAPQASEAHGPAMLRLSMGPLFEEIVQRMSAVSEGASSAPLYAYCGHDTTIMPILASLGIQLRDWPPYLSHVIFELWERPDASGDKPRHYVRCIYNHEELSLAHHPSGEPVPLEEFIDVYLKPYILDAAQYKEECKVSFDHSQPAPGGESMGGSAVQGL